MIPGLIPSHSDENTTLKVFFILMILTSLCSVSRGPPGLLQLSAQAHLLPHLPGPARQQHQEPGHGEGGQHRDVPLQVQLRRLHGHAAPHGEDRARGDL